ncbi:MAG: tetratricopeptide repeat protein [Acidobacteriota bacterium]|nr:tetratricopeptide repeat protein [Acidobacteriota bacterium]
MEAPVVPTIASLEDLDPGVRDAISRAVAEARATPPEAEVFGELATLYHAHRYVDLARECYSIALRLAPDTPDWAYYLGLLSEERGQLDSAKRFFVMVLDRLPTYTPARFRLGNVLLAGADLEGASRQFTTLQAEDPAEPWGFLGSARIATRRGEPEQAARLLEAAFELDPSVEQVRYLLAAAYRELGRSHEASGLLVDLADGIGPASPPDPFLDRIRGGVRSLGALAAAANDALEVGDLARGEEIYLRVLRLEPDHFDALFNLGVLYGRQSRYAVAAQHLSRAVESRPDDANAHFALAISLGSLDRFDEASAQLRTVLRLDPDHVGARDLLAPDGGPQ